MENRDGIGSTGLKTKLIVNYLPQSMTDEEFSQLFSACGNCDCKIVREKNTNYSFGFGFVDYCQPNEAYAAIDKLDGFQIQHKKLKVAFSKPPGSSKNANLYTTGIGKSATEAALKDLFGVYGEVINVKILRESDGTSKEVAFILFKEKPTADAAMKSLQGYSDGYGMNLQIKYAKEQNENQRQHPKYHEFFRQQQGFQQGFQQAVHRPQHPYNMAANPSMVGGYTYNYVPYSGVAAVGAEYGGGYGGKAVRGRGGAARGGGRFNPMARPVTTEQYGGVQVDPALGAINLFVYNIGPEAQDADLYSLFCKFGRINKVNVITGKGYGFVHMPIPDEAHAAMNTLNGMQYNGKTLQVSIKSANSN